MLDNEIKNTDNTNGAVSEGSEVSTENISEIREFSADENIDLVEEADNSSENTNSSAPKADIPAKKKYSYKKSIAAGLAGIILGGASMGYFLGVGLNASSALTNTVDNIVNGEFSFDGMKEDTDAEPVAGGDLAPSGSSIAETVKSVENSVVNINIKAQVTGGWFGQTYESEGSGSGIIYKVDGDKVYVVTNNHVVEDATTVSISITGNEQVSAKLVGKDATSDLAVIYVSKAELEKAGITDIKAAVFGNSDNMQVGENVIAIGNALGRGKTATLGIISAANKTINIDGKKLTMLQTDAAINPGNSGGALVNTNGEVIGINTAKYSSYDNSVEGTGYAIPVSTAKDVINTLMEKGTVDKPYLGISGYTIDENFMRIYGVSEKGVFIGNVESNSAAEKAGLQVSDIITSIDGTPVTTVEELSSQIGKHKSGDQITLTILRDISQQMTVKATLTNLNEQF